MLVGVGGRGPWKGSRMLHEASSTWLVWGPANIRLPLPLMTHRSFLSHFWLQSGRALLACLAGCPFNPLLVASQAPGYPLQTEKERQVRGRVGWGGSGAGRTIWACPLRGIAA